MPLDLYGEYMASIVYFGMLTLPFGAVNVLLIKRIGMTSLVHRQALLNKIESWAVQNIKQKLLLIVVVLAVVAVILAKWSNLRLESVIFVLALTLLTLTIQLYASALQAVKKFFTSGMVGILMTVLKILVGGLVLFFIPKLPLLYLAMVLAVLVAVVIARRWVITSPSKLEVLKYTLSSPLTYFKKKHILIPILATLGMVGMLSIDVMLVKKYFGPDEVGLYASLSLLAKVIFYLTLPLSTVAYTFFTGRDSKQDSLKILLGTSLLVLISGLAIFVGYYFFPELVVKLIFSSKFLQIAPVAYLAGIFGVGYSLAYLYVGYLISINHRASLNTLWILLLQAMALTLYHQSFEQVMTINIMAVSLLVVSCLLSTTMHLRSIKR